MQTSTTVDHEHSHHVAVDDERYDSFLEGIRTTFADSPDTTGDLFTTDAAGLWEAFITCLPSDRRQHYTCNACRQFIERFGGLVRIDAKGNTAPAMWSVGNVPLFFRESVQALTKIVSKANVTGVFLSSSAVLGLPVNKSNKAPFSWHHMATTLDSNGVFKETPLRNASQAMAEKREDFGTLTRGLAEFDIDTARKAHAALTTGGLYRSEKCIGVAKWFLDLHTDLTSTKNKRARDNMVWLAVAGAPVGFCHIRSTMIGTLLEDFAAGKDFADIKRSFDAKMHPLQYMRPQAAPTAGQIAQAEKVVAALDSAGALRRRFARLEDIKKVWEPKPTKPAETGGVFGHLKPKEETAALELPMITMTWTKFVRTVIPTADKIELVVPTSAAAFVALVTAADPDAPPILRWDNEGARYPVSHYIYVGGSYAGAWNLRLGHVEVVAISPEPSCWNGKAPNGTEGVVLVLKGARDLHYNGSGGFFPESLKSEYHAVRATMEAYAKAATVEGADTATACGYMLTERGTGGCCLRVTDSKAGTLVTYKIDRWD